MPSTVTTSTKPLENLADITGMFAAGRVTVTKDLMLRVHELGEKLRATTNPEDGRAEFSFALSLVIQELRDYQFHSQKKHWTAILDSPKLFEGPKGPDVTALDPILDALVATNPPARYWTLVSEVVTTLKNAVDEHLLPGETPEGGRTTVYDTMAHFYRSHGVGGFFTYHNFCKRD